MGAHARLEGSMARTMALTTPRGASVVERRGRPLLRSKMIRPHYLPICRQSDLLAPLDDRLLRWRTTYFERARDALSNGIRNP